MSNNDNLVWNELYRPKTIDDCILSDAIKTQIKNIIADGNIPSMIFSGSPGIGKTTVAKAIASEIDADVMFINASLDGNIDTIRNDVLGFASKSSFTNSKKITILDEFDGMSLVGMQGLKGFLEEFSNNHSIIFTCNNINKIIDPIKSRCVTIDFKTPNSDKQAIITQFTKRVFSILEQEKIEYSKAAVVSLISKKFPDFRKVINELQSYSRGGKIDEGILLNLSEEEFNKLIASLKNKKFNDMRKWIAENYDLDSTEFYRMFYDSSIDKLESKSIPEMILAIGEYSVKESFVVDKEVIRCASLTTIMLSPTIVWK